MGRAYPRREITARKEYFAQTDEVIRLFNQTAAHAQSCMKSSVLFEPEASKKAVKLHDAENGITPAKKQEDDEFPCIRAATWGFLWASTICMIAIKLAELIA